ncbi:hypothetical protein D9M68_944690 [compost metagenome]
MLLGKLGRFPDDRLNHVRRRILETGQVVVAVEAEHIVQHEKRIIYRGLVDRHGSSSSETGCRTGSGWVQSIQNFDVCVNVNICRQAVFLVISDRALPLPK